MTNQKALEILRRSVKGVNFMTEDIKEIDFVPGSNETMVYELSTSYSTFMGDVLYGVTVADLDGRRRDLSDVFGDPRRDVARQKAMNYINELVQ